MSAPRLISRWMMTVLVVNTIIGSGIFGVPSELIKRLGSASPLVMILAALAMLIIMLPVAEVSSHFSAPGGLYLYTRTAFGRFVGLQVGWFWFLAIVGGGAAGVNLFLDHLGTFFPMLTHGFPRIVTVLSLVALPTFVNYRGVPGGIRLSLLLTIIKLLPIALLAVLAFLHRSGSADFRATVIGARLDWRVWLAALLIPIFSYSGYEDALVPTGEIKEPRLTVPFGLISGLLICCYIYTALVWAVVATVGVNSTDHSLVDATSILLGPRGASFVAVLIMISTYGWISGAFFNAPRFAVSLAEQGDCPSSWGKLHPRFQTPTMGILLFAAAVCLLSLTGTFVWAVALSAGSSMVIYGGTCAALVRLRQSQPERSTLRVPFGIPVAIAGIAICILLLSQVDLWHLALMSVTSLLAIGNWLWASNSVSVRFVSAEP